MNNRPSLKRLSIEVEVLNGKYPPTLQELLSTLHRQGFEISERTLQRDIEYLRTDFGLDICYDTSKRTYALNPDNSLYFEAFLRIAQLFNTSDIILQSIRKKEETLLHIAFERDVKDCAGTQYLEPIYIAIRNCKQISFDHENFTTGKISRHTICPYLLKEYDHKWYVIGALPSLIQKETALGKTAKSLHITQYVRTFGLDRIKNLVVEHTKFNPKDQKVVMHAFDHTIGLVYHEKSTEKVILSVDSTQAKYFNRVPLHHTQCLVSESTKEVIFSYLLVPNIELQRLLLNYGASVKVLQPKWFAKQVAGEVKKIMEKYKKFT
jgi:predicted DNA-binding transcriptional regulator YafY